MDLAEACVRELVERTEVDPASIGTVVMGQVDPLGQGAQPGARGDAWARASRQAIPAHTVNRACASANQAIADVASADPARPRRGGIAGGAESLSDVPILHSRRMARILVEASKAKRSGARLAAFARARPRDLVPDTPAIAEPSTGLTMGQSAEKMAKENGISREEQDRIAYASPPQRLGGHGGRTPARPRCAPSSCLPRTTTR